MKTKNIKFTINAEDIRQLGSNAVTHIVTRFVKNFDEKLLSLNHHIADNKAENILKGVEKVIEVLENAQEDFHNLVPLLEQVEPLLSPDTEVVEDLPDLLEDSGGVD